MATVAFMYSSTFPSSLIGVLNSTSSDPTQEIIPRPDGLVPGGGLSLSSLSDPMAWKHLDMCFCTLAGSLLLDRMSKSSAVDTK